jgi:hypothetical protein
MIRHRPAAALAALAFAACTRTPGIEPVVVVDIPAALPAPVEAEDDGRPAHRAPAGPGFVGHWEGVGVQTGGESWEMIVDIDSTGPGRCARVRYPSIPCAAEWICEARVQTGTLRAREHLTEGRSSCIDDGEMTMELSPDGQLDWRWTGADVAAAAHLARSVARR